MSERCDICGGVSRCPEWRGDLHRYTGPPPEEWCHTHRSLGGVTACELEPPCEGCVSMRTHGARGHRRIVVTVPDGEDAEVVAVGAKQAQRLADHGVETSWGGQCRYLVLRRRPGRGA